MEAIIERQTTSSPKAKSKQPFFSGLTLQKKLAIGASNDSYEIEADTMADKVMRMPLAEANTKSSNNTIQRKCSACEKEKHIQKKALSAAITPYIQKKGTGSEGGTASQALTQQINNSQGSGSKMDSNTQNFMESRFGTDFSNVSIHTDSRAIQMSRELNAQAFTVGNAIYFNQGKYNPNSYSGKHLLAHELTHTIQQSKRIQRLFKGTESNSVPSGTINHIGTMSNAQWLQGHRNAGNQFSETVSFLFVGSSLSSQTTTDIATRCNQQSNYRDRIICLHNEVHSAVMVLEGSDGNPKDSDYVCRHYAAAVHDVSQQMGLSPDWETSTTHAWVEFTDNGTQYVVDAYNRILFSYPIP